MTDNTKLPPRPACRCKCEVCERKGKKQCVVTIYFDEVKYDVQYALWQKARFAQGLTEADKERFELRDEDNDWLARQIETYMSNAKSAVVFALPSTDKKVLATDSLVDVPEEYTLTMYLSPTWRGSADLVANALHSYVVNGLLKEWSLMARPDMAASYDAITDGCELKLISLTRCSTLERPVFGF